MASRRKGAAVGYGSALFTMPSGVARPRRPPCTPRTAHFSSTKIKRGKGCWWPQASDLVPGLWCLSCSAKGDSSMQLAKLLTLLQLITFFSLFVSIQTKPACLICIIGKQMHPHVWKKCIGGPAAYIYYAAYIHRFDDAPDGSCLMRCCWKQ